MKAVSHIQFADPVRIVHKYHQAKTRLELRIACSELLYQERHDQIAIIKSTPLREIINACPDPSTRFETIYRLSAGS